MSVDVGVGNLEEKLAPSSEENLIITLEGGEVLLWQQTTQPGVWASTEKALKLKFKEHPVLGKSSDNI